MCRCSKPSSRRSSPRGASSHVTAGDAGAHERRTRAHAHIAQFCTVARPHPPTQMLHSPPWHAGARPLHSRTVKQARRALLPARTRGSQAEDATPPCSPVDGAAMALLSGSQDDGSHSDAAAWSLGILKNIEVRCPCHTTLLRAAPACACARIARLRMHTHKRARTQTHTHAQKRTRTHTHAHAHRAHV